MVQIDFKLVLLGDTGVGKSSIMERIVHDFFLDKSRQSTIGAAFAAKSFISKSGKKIVMGIWDTAGKERYEAMSKIFYRDAKVAIICYNICNRQSWEKMKFWIKELRENEEECIIYLCGTKKDLVDDGLQRRDVDFGMASKYANGIQSKVVETSSKTGANIAELFQLIVEDYLSRSTNIEEFVGEEAIRLDEPVRFPSQNGCWGRCRV